MNTKNFVYVPNIDFLEARIANIQTADDCYVVWSEIQDYLNIYNVTMENYRILYDKVKHKYTEITGKDPADYRRD